MALGGKTVQYTLAVNMETGQLTAESKRVAAELNMIQKQTKASDSSFTEFARSAKRLKSELSLLFLGSFGGYALAVGALGDVITRVFNDISTAYKRMTGELDFENSKAMVLDQTKLIEQYSKELETQGKSRGDILRITAQQKQLELDLAAARSVAEKSLRSFEAAKIKDLNYAELRKQKIIDEQRLAGLEAKSFQQNYRGKIGSAQQFINKLNELALKYDALDAKSKSASPMPRLERDAANLSDRFSPLNLGIVAPDQIAGGLPDSPVGELKTELDNLVENSGVYQSFFMGLSAGFASFGEALVSSGQPLKNFGATFLKLIAQLAVQFGSFLILYGTGMGFVPGGTVFSAGAIAAGVALTVFGGALGALAGKLGGQGGGARGGDRDQRFRDSNFNTSGGNGGTTIINNINFANTIGLTRDSMKEVGEVISAELFKQGKLGRIETVG
jgi:hypothetical protein